MTAKDCFEMGRQSYLNEDYYHTLLWMREAMDRLQKSLNESDSNLSQIKADILEYLAFSTYKEGNVLSALGMTNELLEIEPDHERAMGNKIFYEREIANTNQVKKLNSKLRGDDGSNSVVEEEIIVSITFFE